MEKRFLKNCINFVVYTILLMIFSILNAFAQDNTDISNPSPTQQQTTVEKTEDTSNIQVPKNPSPKSTTGKVYYPKTPYEVYLSMLTILLGIFMAALLCVMGWKNGLTDDFTQTFIVVMAIFAALFLIVAGYDKDQTAPVFGILGTVLGYVFGKSQANNIAKNMPVESNNHNNERTEKTPSTDSNDDQATATPPTSSS